MPERTRSYRALFTTLVSALIGLLLSALSLSEPQPVIEIRNIIFDSFQRAAPRPFDPAMPARVVDIDDDSIQKYGQWPWPRTVLARLIEAIGRKDPLVIALDILLSEPDRASPDHLLAMLPPSPERDALELRLKTSNFSNDAILAETLSKYPVVAGMVMAHGGAPPLIRAGFAVAGDNPAVFLPKFSGAVTPIPVLQPVLKGVGGLNWLPEYDQVVRNIPTLFSSGDNLVPSLAVEALRVAQGASTIIVKASNASGETAFGRETGIVSLKIGQIVLPTDADGSLRPHYAGARAERRIPAWKVLEGVTARDELHGRIVFIGASASALADLRATPLNPVVPGVEVHAEVIEHALSGGTLARPDWAQGAEAVTTFLGAVLAGLAAYHLLPLVAAFGCLAVLGLMGYGAWTLFLQAHLLLNPALPGLAVIAAFAVVSVARWKTSDAERKAVRTAFAHYLSPAMVERLAQSPEALSLGGEQRRMTVLFGDVRGFTSLAETYKGEPQALTTLMNRLLTPLSNAIIDHNGTIDKYMGDAIMAFWNAPLDVPDHAGEACRAALDMRARLAGLNDTLRSEAERAGRSHVPIAIGIGINTGDCTVGNMGSDIRFDYSVLGDPVNLASRLEGQSKTYGVSILMGETTAAAVSDRFALVEIDLIRVKGKQEPQRVFALLDERTASRDAEFDSLAARFQRLHEAYRNRRWDAAQQALAELRTADIPDDLIDFIEFMDKRIRAFRAMPPPEGWDGVHDAETK